MLKIGIMQGRLLPSDPKRYQVFPKTAWREEFKLASELGFKSLELLFDVGDFKNNPLLDNKMIFEIIQLAESSKITIDSVCADYFRINGFINTSLNCIDYNLSILKTLIINCSKIDIRRIIIPLMDATKIRNEDDIISIKSIFSELYELLKKNDVLLCFETDLNAKDNLNFMNTMDFDNVKIQYDLGNAAGFGFDIVDEITILNDFIVGVHIKDRDLSGNNVVLGTGVADLKRALELLQELEWLEDIILETTMADNPIEFAKNQLKFVKDVLK